MLNFLITIVNRPAVQFVHDESPVADLKVPAAQGSIFPELHLFKNIIHLLFFIKL